MAKRKPAHRGSEGQTTRKKDSREAEVGEKPAKKKAKLSLAAALELLEKPAPKGSEGQTTREKDSREAEVAEKPAKKKEKEKTSEGPFENEINQLVREICVIEDKSAKLLEKKLKLEEQLQQVRFEEEQEQQKLFTKRKSLRAAVCNAREIENTQRLDKLPQEVWEKILDNLKSDDLFPLALSCRYFRQKQKELVERGSQHGPESDEVRLALKMNLKRKLDEAEYQPASADYLRFCSKEKVPRRSVPRRSSSVHFMGHKEIVWRLAAFHGHLPLLQELLKRLFMLDRDFIKYAGESSSSSSSLVWLLTSFSLLHSARRPSGDLAVAAPAGC